MMSGYLRWDSGNLLARGAGGRFWASTTVTYTSSWYLYFNSTNVGPKGGLNKPGGLTLRCVARFTCVFLPELSAAFLFRL